jgi:ankyrin repeat protein
MFAVLRNKADVVKILLDYGANINLTNSSGLSVIQMA